MNPDHDFDTVYAQAIRYAVYIGRGRLDPDDCVSEAGIACIVARDTYDAGKGVPFKMFVFCHVRWRVGNTIRGRRRYVLPGDEYLKTVPCDTGDDDHDDRLDAVRRAILAGATIADVQRMTGLTSHVHVHKVGKLIAWIRGSRATA